YPGRLRILEEDALTIDEASLLGPGAHIVANLPYNIGTALLVRWLTAPAWPPFWASLTLMFQKEVADRIVAVAGSEAYGRLSILAQWRSTARLALPVHRSAFVPPPKVMSAVVHIVPAEQPADVVPAHLEALTAAAFGQRRKMLRQSLKAVTPDPVAIIVAAGLEETIRAENVPVEGYVALANALDAMRGKA
ncbi:MAG TPA: rRNA adenine dimethyltransferase family protein, partial [Microvirga sp.]|nr:rRNA adenine dimethyltransferase family protein [Microvirga sp.]